jgi:hypothetical protein
MELNKYRLREGEVEGRWFDLGEGASIKLAGINSPAYQEALQEAIERERDLFRRAARPGASEELKRAARKRRAELVRDLMAEHLILDWRGITERGQEVPYTKEAAKRIMREYPRFADIVAELAVDGFEEEATLDQEGIENAKNG